MKLDDAFRFASRASKYANVDSAKRFAQHVVPEVVRPARVIWNQAIGALFLMLAASALFRAVQLYRELGTNPKSGFGLGVSCFFVAVMLYFGISSFLKARRIGSRVTRH